jgi:DNA modification methylase
LAGGRRFTALTSIWEQRERLLEASENIDPSIVRFLQSGELELGKHYTSKEDAFVEALDLIELEENIRRKAFDWKEQVCAIAYQHQRKTKRALASGERWSQKQTGELLGVSHASISYALALHKFLQDPKHPIQKCGSATNAIHLLTKLRADEARRAKVMISTEKPKAKGKVLDLEQLASDWQGAGTDVSVNRDLLQAGFGRIQEEAIEASEAEGTVKVNLSETIFLGDFLELDLPQVDHIITDPPYGIEMSNLSNDVSQVAETHIAEDNIAYFKPWIQKCYDWLGVNGFCIMFCDLIQFKYLYDLSTATGFKVQRWPFVWIKTHTCANQAVDFNFTKNYETAIVMRKGSATLLKPQSSSYFMASSLPTKKLLNGHPFVKPLDLWQHLAKAVAIEGETIGDPFSGIGSMPRALRDIGYKTITCEINEDFYNQQVLMLRQFYSERWENVEFS